MRAHGERATRLAVKARQCGECGGRAAIAIDEPTECPRPDPFRADQAQPGEPLLIAQRASTCPIAHDFDPIRLSSPARRRLMLCACFAHKSTVRSANTSAALKR